MSQKTRAQIATEIAVNLPDNTTELITPAIVRTTLTDITDSAPNTLTDRVWTAAAAGGTVVCADGAKIYIAAFTSNTAFTLPGSPTSGMKVQLSLEACDGIAVATPSASYYRVGDLNTPSSTFTPRVGNQLLVFEYIDGRWTLDVINDITAQIILRQGTTSEVASITPAQGEPIWDYTLGLLSVGDGVTAGGKVVSVNRLTDAQRLAITPSVGMVILATDTSKFYVGDGVTVGGKLFAVVLKTPPDYTPVPTSIKAPYDPSVLSFGLFSPKPALAGSGAVGSSGAGPLQGIVIGGLAIGGSNGASGSFNGGNGGGSTGSAAALLQIHGGLGGDASPTAAGGNGGLIQSLTPPSATGVAVIQVHSGNGGIGGSSTGAGGAGGRIGSFMCVGGNGGTSVGTAAGGAGGTGPNTAGLGITALCFESSSGAGGVGDGAIGGSGGRYGALRMRGGNGGNASGATPGAAGGNAGSINLSGTDASAATAGLNSGSINLSAGSSFAGGSMDLSDGQNILTIQGLAGQFGHRVAVPASSASAGLAGQWASDDSFLYFYGATAWRRIAGVAF